MKGGDGEEIVSIYFELGPENCENPLDEDIKELLKLNKSNIFKVYISGGNVTAQFITVRFKNRDYKESMDDKNFVKELEKLKKVLSDMKHKILRFVFHHKQQPNPIDYGLNINNRQMDNNSITRYNDFLTELKEEIES